MDSMEFEIQHYREINAGGLKASFSLVFRGMRISDCKLFSSGERSWWTFPQKEMKDPKGGKSKYFSYVFLLDRELTEAFQQAVLKSLKTAIPQANNYGKKAQ